MIELVWIIATLSRYGTVSENTRFSTPAACESFGKETAPRMEDWVRGYLRADWQLPVKVTFQCVAAKEIKIPKRRRVA